MIKIITDNGADLPIELLREKHIDVVPLGVRMEGYDEEYLSKLDGKDFWEAVTNSSTPPKTSAPAPGVFAELFGAAQQEGYDGALCITIAAGFSSTYESAVVGAKAVENFPIEVIDSKSVTLGEGLLVLFAQELAEEGRTLTEIADLVKEKREKVKIVALFDTLEYLRLGGRIGPLSSMIGSLLSVKPIIEVSLGGLKSLGKQRTKARAIEFLITLLKETNDIDKVAVVHSGAADISRVFEQVSEITGQKEILLSYIGPIVGAYSGPGAIGFCIMEK